MRVNVDMSVEQARVIIKALDLLSRLHMGQMDEVELFYRWAGIPMNRPIPCEKVRQLCSMIKSQVFPELTSGGYYAISSSKISEEARVAYDLIQALRYPIAWEENPKGDITVNYDMPTQTAKCDLAKVAVE